MRDLCKCGLGFDASVGGLDWVEVERGRMGCIAWG